MGTSSALRAAPAAIVVVVAAIVSAGAAPPFESVGDAPNAAQGEAAVQQRPSYGARVEVIRLHAAVLDGDGNPVTDLRAEDFVVIDNGVEYDVALALTPANAPIDVALVFDQSDSIRLGAPTVKRDARAFLDALVADDCAFVLPFQHRIGPGIWGPSVDPSLLRTIDLTPLEGGTSFNDAMMVGLAEVQRWNIPDILADRVVTEYQQPIIEGGVGIDLAPASVPTTSPAPDVLPDRSRNIAAFSDADLPFRVFATNLGCGAAESDFQAERRKALVVITDGLDTTSAHSFGELLGFVYQTDVPVFTVVIGHPGAGGPPRRREAQRAVRIAETRLRKLAEVTGGRMIVGSGSESRLREAYDEVITILRGSYLLGYYPAPSAGAVTADEVAHEHEVEVRVRRRGLEVFARSEYLRTSAETSEARALLRSGAILALEERLDEALATALQAVAADPQLWDAHFLEAAVRWMSRDSDGARVALQRALWLEPGVVAAHRLAWQLFYELEEDTLAWSEAIRAHLAGADMAAEIEMLAQRSAPPEDLEAHLGAPRVFIEGQRSDDPKTGMRLAPMARALARAVSSSAILGLVRDPLVADYFLYLDADDVDARRPARLQSRLQLSNTTYQRLWREDLDVVDMEDAEQVETAAIEAVSRLEAWLAEGR